MTRPKGSRSTPLAEAEAIWRDVCGEVRRRHALAVEASGASSRAMIVARDASQYETDAIVVARDLATAMQGGAGSSKPPSLGDVLVAARALLDEADASLDHGAEEP